MTAFLGRSYTIRYTGQVRLNSHARQVYLIVYVERNFWPVWWLSGDRTTYENFILTAGQASKPDVCLAIPSVIPEQDSFIDLTSSGRFFLFEPNAIVKLCFNVENLIIILLYFKVETLLLFITLSMVKMSKKY